jgi:hypothetical protein
MPEGVEKTLLAGTWEMPRHAHSLGLPKRQSLICLFSTLLRKSLDHAELG